MVRVTRWENLHLQRINALYRDLMYFLPDVYEIASPFGFINLGLIFAPPCLHTSHLGFLDTFFFPRLSSLAYFSLFNLCNSVFIPFLIINLVCITRFILNLLFLCLSLYSLGRIHLLKTAIPDRRFYSLHHVFIWSSKIKSCFGNIVIILLVSKLSQSCCHLPKMMQVVVVGVPLDLGTLILDPLLLSPHYSYTLLISPEMCIWISYKFTSLPVPSP